MSRTSQLQIRVSPEQKATLKRLAAAAGQNVSAYVLARALPRASEGLARTLDELRRGGDARTALPPLGKTLFGLDGEALEASLASMDVAGLAPPLQNRLAGLAESVAHARGVYPPDWAAAVAPLARPHFRWPLASLRPYQMRATPPAYKRRNLFDPQLPRFEPPPEVRRQPYVQNLATLADHLAVLELDVEFYFIAVAGGSAVWQAFPARPTNARPRTLFEPSPGGDPVVANLAVPPWNRPAGDRKVVDEVVRAVAGQRGFLELPHLTVFQPPVEYALAMKVATWPREPLPGNLDDLRFLLRSLDIVSEDAAHAAVAPYLGDRYVPPRAREALRMLLAV